MLKKATANEQRPLILRLLERVRPLDATTVGSLLTAQAKQNTSLEDLLIRRSLATDREIAAAYADHFVLPLHSPALDDVKPDRSLRDLVPDKLCRDHIIAPLACDGELLDVAFFTPSELLLVDELELLSGCTVQPHFAPLSVIERHLSDNLNFDDEDSWASADADESTDFEEVEDSHEEEVSADEGGVVHLDQPPPPGRDGRTIRYVNRIFEQALRRGASDVHIEPFEGRCRVRLRVDGGLNEIAPPPLSMFNAIVSRIKVLAKMDIAEKRLPQDGAISLRGDSRRVDLRVNTCPTVHGEKVVLRVLDKDAIPLDLAKLGFDEQQKTDLTESICMPHGLALVTGPTGSGKSTTLYSCLNLLNGPEVNICTVEDPVEYKFLGMNQVQTRSQIGLNFASALRSFLRQDPDVIMVGEVRDAETAQICLRAALTGHFVLSTLHTNDALAAVNRLTDMEVEPFLLASTLRAVVAQRLIRRLCPHCRESYSLDSEMARKLKLPAEIEVFRPIGCKECSEKGYKGRVGVFEVIRFVRKLADMVQNSATVNELRDGAEDLGMKLLAHGAMEKVRDGLTSVEEALSISITED